MLKIVEEFISAENDKRSRIDRFFDIYPDYYFLKSIRTEDLSKYDYDLNKVIKIKPSVFTRFIALCFFLFGLFFCLILLNTIASQILLPVTIPIFLFACAWTGAVVWLYFLNPKSSFKILISHSGIGISNLYLTWNSLADVIVMQKGGGSHQRTTLVLFTTDRKIHKYSLNNLSVSFKKLLPIIENYQTRSKQYL